MIGRAMTQILHMTSFKEYTHLIPSLEVYPRAHYFSKRYNDFREKFNKFTGKHRNILPGNQVEAPKNCFEHGLIVKVIGNEDLNPDAFVAAEPHLYKTRSSTSPETNDGGQTDCIVPVNPYQDKVRASSKRDLESSEHGTGTGVPKDDDGKSSNSPRITVVICNATVESLDDEGLQEIEHLLNQVANIKDAQLYECFLLCRSATEFTASEEEEFRKEIVRHSKRVHPLHRIFIGTRTVTIKNELSLHLEGKLAHYFVTAQSRLQQFTKGQQKGNFSAKPLLEEETVARQIKCILEKGLGDVVPISEKNKGYMDSVLSKLSLIVKCIVTHPLSERFNMPIGLCNHILIANDFEQNTTSNVSEHTRYHLGKLKGFVKQCQDIDDMAPTESFQSKYFHFLLHSLQKDLADAVLDMERVFRQIATTVKKMLFEISSCLKKTKVDKEQIQEIAQQANTKVDTDLRKEILGLKDVFGVGTIYGRLEIHVNSKESIEEVESVARELLRRNNMFCPFIVRAIESKVEKFADGHGIFEHGEQIECTTGTGTLAGFVEGSDQKLYGLTCAHVVKDPTEQECNVFIVDSSNNKRVLFARSLPHLIVSTGDETKPLIDLAALPVLEHMQNKCTKFLKDDNCMPNPGIIAADTTIQLAGDYVYKHGAITQCTKGLVCSDDYNVLSTDELNYIILIDNYDEDGDDFAQPGDSGSMICTPDENEVYIVKAIGILSGGKFTPVAEETPKYFSFRLIDGLRKLTTKAGGVQFNFPKV